VAQCSSPRVDRYGRDRARAGAGGVWCGVVGGVVWWVLREVKSSSGYVSRAKSGEKRLVPSKVILRRATKPMDGCNDQPRAIYSALCMLL
jgi:hypothetical protein